MLLRISPLNWHFTCFSRDKNSYNLYFCYMNSVRRDDPRKTFFSVLSVGAKFQKTTMNWSNTECYSYKILEAFSSCKRLIFSRPNWDLSHRFPGQIIGCSSSDGHSSFMWSKALKLLILLQSYFSERQHSMSSLYGALDSAAFLNVDIRVSLWVASRFYGNNNTRST